MADQHITFCQSGFQAYNAVKMTLDIQFGCNLSPTAFMSQKFPSTSLERLSSAGDGKTILYLAYGSNLSAETFKGNRGIKPISALNVHVPSLNLEFDLPGVPYTEPCFANTSYRTIPNAALTKHHKNGWHKGLVGVVYEVTLEDYRTIKSTEGGGASYIDIVVECYALPVGKKTVEEEPSGATFKAHTLFCPPNDKTSRPDPYYAQASARYLKLLTDGGEEHSLPDEYMAYLYNLQPYTITTRRQSAGKYIFATLWMPLILPIMGLGKLFADKEGKIPSWLARIFEILFRLLWLSYDKVFKPAFGDGERTIEKGDEEVGSWGDTTHEELDGRWCEKRVMLP